MKLTVTTVLIGLLMMATSMASAERTKLRRELTFVVKNPDKAKNIAKRFHLAPSALTKLNKPLRKNQMVTAGKHLHIPVWLRKQKTITPGRKESIEFSMAEYELEPDSVEGDINADFICLADIEADSARRITIDKELVKTDRQIAVLNYRIDSMQGAPDAVTIDNSRDDKEMQLALRKMQIARERHYGKLNLGMGIDSLEKTRYKLRQERSKIDSRRDEYDYLVSNVEYIEKHNDEPSTKIIINEWGDDPDKGKSHNKRK